MLELNKSTQIVANLDAGKKGPSDVVKTNPEISSISTCFGGNDIEKSKENGESFEINLAWSPRLAHGSDQYQKGGVTYIQLLLVSTRQESGNDLMATIARKSLMSMTCLGT